MTHRLFAVLALFAAIGIFFFYINPTWTGPIANAKAAIARDNEALAAARDYTARENELASARNAIDPANLDRLEAFLPDAVDNVGVILDLNALAARSGLSINTVDVTSPGNANVGASANGAVTPVNGKGKLGFIDLSLTASGTYDALKQFLKGVELSERLLDVRDLTIKGSETGVYTYTLTIRLYWLR